MKRTLTSIAAASMALGTLVPTAFAGTNGYTYNHRSLTFGSYSNASVPGFAAKAWGSTPTEFMGVWYLMQALKGEGLNVSWDYANRALIVGTAPSTVPASGKGTATIYYNGQVVTTTPYIMTNDPSTKQPTSYMPVYYMGLLLKAAGFNSNYDGTSWTVASAATLAIKGNSNIGVGGKDSLTLTATSNGTTTTVTSGATWSVSGSGDAFVDASGNFTATKAGTYTVTAAYQGQTATASVLVYGSASAFTISATSLVADGTSTSTATINAVDASGNIDANFNGTATVADTAGLIAAATAAGDQAADYSSGTVTFTNGVATVVLGPTTNVNQTDTVTVTGTGTTAGFNSVSTTVTSVTSALSKLALSIETGSPSAVSANGQYFTNVTVTAENAQGNTWTGQPGTYVTLTLTGPGSFVAGSTAVTTMTEYIPTSGSLNVPVYSMAGQPGSIVVSAAATGLTGASLTVNSYINTAPASISVAPTAGTDSNGNPYTLYTVELLDTNGHPITTTGTVDAYTVSDNAASVSGGLYYGTVSSTGVFTGAAASSHSGTMTNGVATFAVETQTVGTGPVTLTFNDTTNSLTATGTYSFAAGKATKLALTPSNLYDVKAGQSVTVSAQLEDPNGNTVSKAGDSVVFSFASNTAGLTFPTGQTTYTVTTNASGVASLTFAIPSDTTGGSFQLSATDSNFSGTYNSNAITVLSATNTSNYATQMTVTQGVYTVSNVNATIGSAIPANITITAENAVGTAVAENDVFSVTSSNTSVIGVTNATINSASGIVANLATAAGLTLGMAGSSTITVKDLSNASAPSVSFTMTVAPGAASGRFVEYNGSPISSSNTVSVAANTPIALTIVNGDSAGDPLPVTGSTAQTYNLTVNAGVYGDFRTTPTGASVNTVTFQPGQSSVTLYFVSSTAETLTTGSFTVN